MASALYPLFKQALLNGTVTGLSSPTVKARLVNSTNTPYNATHEFISSLAGTAIGTDQTLTTKTFASGVLDADDDVWPAIASGSTINAIIIYIDTGTTTSSRLVCWIDGFTAVATNGNTVTVTWDNGTNKIFSL